MSSTRCKLLEIQDKRDLLEISQLIDLTDKPVGLTRNEIGWSKVKSNASNCICCCSNNTITLVTTEDSYVMEHVPLDNILQAQTNANLQYLAISNHRRIAIIDLVDNDINCGCYANNNLPNETKFVNLAAYRLTVEDVILWRWIDNDTIAIITHDALYTCSVDQQLINHPALTAFSTRSRYLSMQKVLDVHQNLSALCQINDVMRDVSGNIYAISSLYSTHSLLRLDLVNSTQTGKSPALATTSANPANSTLRPSFGSMPSRLSQLVNHEQSLDSLKSEQLFENGSQQISSSTCEDEICGLVQVYCKSRDRTQLIQAHAITFTSPSPISDHSSDDGRTPSPGISDKSSSGYPTILVAANKIGKQMRVHFVEMVTGDQCSSTGQNYSQTVKFDRLSSVDFPTSVTCAHVDSDQGGVGLHIALIATKHGQLYVCSVTHSTILFNTTITNDIISSAVLESNSQGLMVICRNGQVLLVRLKLAKLLKLLDESKSLRHISSSRNLLSSMDVANNNSITSNDHASTKFVQDTSSMAEDHLSTPLDVGLDSDLSTRL